MEKKRKCIPPKRGILQEWRIFRTISCVLFLMVCPAALMAQQAQTFTKDFKEAPLTDVFDYLSSHSDYVFTYNSAEVSRSAVRVNRSFKDALLANVLNDCLADSPFTFELVGRHVVIKKRAATPASPTRLTGKVTDEKGQPLPGVTVMIKGTSLGTATDANGEFLLKLPLANGK